MRLQKVTTPEDVEIVKSFFYDIFWELPDYDLIHFYKSITGKHDFKRLEYYLGYEGDEVVGVCGVYADREDECWLGWFGVRPQYRQRGYATMMLNLQLEIMKNYGYKVCRLYTDEVINKNAFALYLKSGFKKDSSYVENVVTMVKSLDGVIRPTKWKGKPLAFA